jgi:N-methylhydantoinase B
MPEERSLANERQRRRESLRYGYIPPDEIVVDPSLRFHRQADRDLDTVGFEVIRSKLWNLNVDHGDAIRRVSGSNIVAEGYDFNCAITTEEGDAVTLCPYSMFFAGFADEVIKWTLEHRSMNVGIHDGDVFVQDDPWVGSNHPMDTSVFGPVFVEGKLFAWLFNCIHQREIGGLRPGGFVQDATDCYAEPTFLPPTKLVEGGVLREDIVDLWTRRSRLPDLIALELGSQIAGFNTARARLEELLTRYGATTVKGTMNKMIRDTSRTVGERLARLPDANWRDERYVAGANPGNLRLYKLCLEYEKRGDRLRVSNAGTDPAVGAFNITPGVFRASVLNGLLPILAYDQYLCAAGVLRQLDFEYERGAITTASHPAAVSTSMGSVSTVNQAQVLAAHMVSGDDELAGHAFSSSAMHTMSTTAPSWEDERGNRIGDAILDMLAGGLGAFNHRDGIDYGGTSFSVANHFSDVEKFEQVIPFLYLFRRELPECGGHGRFRGGVTLSAAWVGHGGRGVAMSATGNAKSVTMGIGVCGGFPGTGGYHWHAADTGIQAWLEEGRLPGDPGELRALAPHGGPVGPSMDHRLGSDDVFELLPNPGAGWGDPLERGLDLVEADLREGRLSIETALRIYAVIVDAATGEVDAAQTARERERVLAQRLALSREARRACEERVEVSADTPRVLEGVALTRGRAGACFACAHCGQALGPAQRTYRLGCRELDMELPEISEIFQSPLAETGEALLFRRYLCPGCARGLAARICRPSDPPFDDVRVPAR